MATRMSGWRPLMDKNFWCGDYLNHAGPAVYEFALGGSRGSIKHIVYAGETKALAKRMKEYATHGSHLSQEIDWHLRQGWTIYFRYRPASSKLAAKHAQDLLLGQFDYDWNVMLNSKRAA